MKRKKLNINLSKNDLPQEIKDFIIEQSKVIDKLNNRIKELEKENKELKKNFS